MAQVFMLGDDVQNYLVDRLLMENKTITYKGSDIWLRFVNTGSTHYDGKVFQINVNHAQKHGKYTLGRVTHHDAKEIEKINQAILEYKQHYLMIVKVCLDYHRDPRAF